MTKRHSVGEAMVENVGRMADALDRFANTQDATVTRMRMCWEALDPLDIEESLKYKALAFLEGEMKAATFLALPLESRKMDRKDILRIFATAITTVSLLWYHYSYFLKDAVHESSLSGDGFIWETLIGNSRKCFDLFRMSTNCFMLLANELKRRKFMKDSRLDCVGAIDGTHIPAWVRLEDQVRYHNRKGSLSQNVMAVVSFDMKFQYVVAGWEGSASDARILQESILKRPHNKFHVPIVERTFAALKQRFALLQIAPRYPIKTQAKIVVACCVLHNFIRQWNLEDAIFHEAMNETLEDVDMGDELNDNRPENNILGPNDANRNYMIQLRESIAEEIWAARGGS
ncbi:putative nuclease HARBI1 [Cinnamomum micranthum f. kanehirae]|uniref:Putative nuclease HARBI1 n=1 Tax=Cinnamomum micranthum f. kanehirae TaxID=337451 RepID=A0A3S3NRW8_9MAGN|nr:putative nuclease HARBI1 [Cinnamomum micranthum f. kanehirae]